MIKDFFATIGLILAAIFGTHSAPAPSTQPPTHYSAPIAPTSSVPLGAGTFPKVDAPPVTTVMPSSPWLSPTDAVTHTELTAVLDKLGNSLRSQFFAVTASGPSSSGYSPDTSSFVSRDLFSKQIDSIYKSISLSQRIDQLSNVTISNATVHGVSGLTAADIPTDIVASNYLPLAGGILTGALTATDLTLSGNLTVAGAQTLSGAITVPYLVATSTTAVSSFQQLLVSGSTTLQNFTFVNATGTAATTTALFATVGHFATGIIDTLTSVLANFGTITATNATITNSTTTNEYSSNLAAAAARFGATATSTFSSAGALTLASPLAVSSGGTGSTTLFGILKGAGTSQVATAIAGTDYQVPLSFSYPIQNSSNVVSLAFGTTTANTWSSIQTLANGLLSLASSTIGSGTQAGGLTISGGATTTGNAYFAGNIGIGTSSPTARLQVLDKVRIVSTGFADLEFSAPGAGGNYNRIVVNSSISPTIYLYDAIAGEYFGSWSRVGTSIGQLGINRITSYTGTDLLLQPSGTGNVGINDTTPLSLFTVGGGDAFQVDASGRVFASIGASGAGNLAYSFVGDTDTGFYRSAANEMRFQTAGSDRITVNASGNVGIGTTSPFAKLSVEIGAAGTVGVIVKAAASQTANLTEWRNNNGDVLAQFTSNAVFVSDRGISSAVRLDDKIIDVKCGNGNCITSVANGGYAVSGTSATVGVFGSGNSFGVQGSGGDGVGVNGNAHNGWGIYGYADNIGIAGYFKSEAGYGLIVEKGNTGLATTSPWRKLSVTGTVGFDGLTGNFGAGSLCLTASKEVVYNAGSDACLSSLRSTKHDIAPLNLDALAAILALQPVSFIYNGDASSAVRYGFIAEDTEAINRSLATHDARGKVSGIDDRGILSVLVKALQLLISTVAGFAERVTTQTLVADNVTANAGTFQKLCVGATCVTEAEFKELLDKQGVSPTPPPSEASTSTSPEGETATTTDEIPAPPLAPDYNDATTSDETATTGT